MENFPGNSYAARAAQNKIEKPEATSEPKQEAKKVVTGKVIERKKPLGERLKRMFIQDGGGFGEYLLEQVVVPMMKDMVLSIITQSADGFRQGIEDRLFSPDERGRRVRTSSYGTGRRVDYQRVSTNVRRYEDRPPMGSYRRSNEVKDVILESREEADMVLEELDALIDSMGHCTVGDYYDLVRIVPKSTDQEWGWTDLSRARVRKVDGAFDQFLIDMPRPHAIRS